MKHKHQWIEVNHVTGAYWCEVCGTLRIKQNSIYKYFIPKEER